MPDSCDQLDYRNDDYGLLDSRDYLSRQGLDGGFEVASSRPDDCPDVVDTVLTASAPSMIANIKSTGANISSAINDECDCIVCRNVGSKSVSVDDQNRYRCRVQGCSWSTHELRPHKYTSTLIASREHEKEHFNRVCGHGWSCLKPACNFHTIHTCDWRQHVEVQHGQLDLRDLRDLGEYYECMVKDCDCEAVR